MRQVRQTNKHIERTTNVCNITITILNQEKTTLRLKTVQVKNNLKQNITDLLSNPRFIGPVIMYCTN